MSLQAIAGSDASGPNNYSDAISDTASALASNGSAGVVGVATSAATGYASSSIEDWLGRFGTARVQLNVDENGNWDDSSFDFLAPLYDNKKTVLFTQLGMRAPDDRMTGNLGFGVRTFNDYNWMLGVNSFIDDDFTGGNRRVGFGGEAWTDNLKLSANGYVGTTDWHSSRDFSDYDEKPADGFDIRAEGYLPAYPQLGAKLMYEQYYGEDVALFDTDHLQNNPSAVTVGINYTPIPLVTVGVDYKRGQDSMDDTQFSLAFHYTLGQSWQSQISTDQVAWRRSLAGSRYDLVERNNEIVLNYRKQDKPTQEAIASGLVVKVVRNEVAADGVKKDVAMARVTYSDGTPATNITVDWSVSGSATLMRTNSTTDNQGIATVALTDSVAETVDVKATAQQITQSAQATFVNSGGEGDKVIVSTVKGGAMADGHARDILRALVTDANGKPLANQRVSWSDGSATAQGQQQESTTNARGAAFFTLTDTVPETVTVTAKTDKANGSGDVSFVSRAIGPIAGPIPQDIGGDNYVSINDASGGVDFQIPSYPGMQAGDKMVLHVQVVGDDGNPSHNPRSQSWTSAVHTVTASEVGQPITITAPQSAFYDDNGEGIEDTKFIKTGAYAVVKSVNGGKAVKSSFTHIGVDTIAPGG